MRRVMELKDKDPDSFGGLYSMLRQEEVLKKEENDRKELTEGAIPGTRTPPWATTGDAWQNFFNEIMRKENEMRVGTEEEYPDEDDDEDDEEGDNEGDNELDLLSESGTASVKDFNTLIDNYNKFHKEKQKKKKILWKPLRILLTR